jgi:ElaB/YqjD/DUF883 family membrane-anchored ribosome-binding protein
MNATSDRPGSSRDPEQLERAAERIRESLDRTLDALERKLQPSRLLDQSLSYLREHGGEMVTAVGDSVRRNPVPILLTVAGIGWLVASSLSSSRKTIDVTPPEATSATSGGSRFRDRASMARAQARRAQYRAISALEERPLLFGGLAVALGALLGAIVPSTEYEDRVVGQVRDRAVERAKQMGERQYQNLRTQFEPQRDDLEVSGQAH